MSIKTIKKSCLLSMIIGFGILPSLSWAQEGFLHKQSGISKGSINENGSISDWQGAPKGRIDKNGNVYDWQGAFVGHADVNHPISAWLLLQESQKK